MQWTEGVGSVFRRLQGVDNPISVISESKGLGHLSSCCIIYIGPKYQGSTKIKSQLGLRAKWKTLVSLGSSCFELVLNYFMGLEYLALPVDLSIYRIA